LNRSRARRSREVIFPLCSALIKPHVGTASSFGCDTGNTGKLINWSKFKGGPLRWLGLEHLTHEERMRKLGMFCLENGRFQGA